MFNLHPPGAKVATSMGDIEIVKDISAGGEGQGYLATLKGKQVFYKAFHQSAVPPRSPEETRNLRNARTKTLVDSGIWKLDERINSPFAYSKEGGYVCAWIDGLMPLWCEPEDGPSFLSAARTYEQRVGVFLQVIDLLKKAHAKGFSHGDLNSDNIGVVISGDTVRVYLIDWSNFFAGDQKQPPLMAGSEGSMAWWIRARGELPDMRSDIYSLALYGHELLLSRPVVQGCATVAEMISRLEKGDLPGDPLRGRALKGNDTGLPFESLAPELQSLFRMMLRPQSDTVPSIEVVSRTLEGSLPNLMQCEFCHCPLWWHAARTSCPKCSKPIGSALHFVVAGKQIPITGTMVLGRADFGGDAGISGEHLRVHPVSPGIGHLTVLGFNGIKRQRGAERVRAARGQTLDIVAGDSLEIAVTGGGALVIKVA